jgi:signal transduction histidine kinase
MTAYQMDKKLIKKELEMFQLKNIFTAKEALLLETLKQVEHNRKKIIELEKLRDDLTHMIVHDLKNPLEGILSSAELFKGGFLGQLNDNQLKFINIIFFNARRLSNLAMDLLDIRRFEEKKLSIRKEEFPADELITNLSWMHDLAHKEQKIVEMNISGIQTIFADKHLLIRVLENLLSNAIKHTQHGGKITLCIQKNDRRILFEVIDTGEGIPSEYVDRVFDKFFKVETQDLKTKIDTGLGLTFCKMAVEEQGGKIALESTVGKGSRFYFTLPSK